MGKNSYFRLDTKEVYKLMGCQRFDLYRKFVVHFGYIATKPLSIFGGFYIWGILCFGVRLPWWLRR